MLAQNKLCPLRLTLCYIFLRLRETHNALQLLVFFFLWLCQPYPKYRQILSKTYTILQMEFRFLNCTAVIKIRKNFSNFTFLPKQYKAITLCWSKQNTSNNFQTLQAVYTYSNCMTINYIWLTNVSTNICSEIRLILWIVCNLQCERVGRSWKVG